MSPALRSQLLDALLAVTSLLQGDMERDLTARGLTPARMHVLWLVGDGEPWTQAALAAELKVTPRNVTGLVDALESTGFVSRSPHPTDRRATVVVPTEAGARTLADVRDARAELEVDLAAGLTEGELEALVASLSAVTTTLVTLIEDHADQQSGTRA